MTPLALSGGCHDSEMVCLVISFAWMKVTGDGATEGEMLFWFSVVLLSPTHWNLHFLNLAPILHFMEMQNHELIRFPLVNISHTFPSNWLNIVFCRFPAETKV